MMNQNNMAGSEIFFEPAVKKDAKYYRTAARGVLKEHFWRLLAMLLISTACTALIGGAVYLGMQVIALSAQSFGALIAMLVAAMAVMIVLTALLTPFSVAIVRAQLHAMDGEAVRVSDLWRGFGHRFGANLLTGLLVMGAMLATALVGIIGFLMTEIAAINASPMILLGVLLLVAAVVLLLWLAIRLAFVFHVRAEYPELSAWDSIHNSFALTKSNGKKILTLALSFIGWYLLAELIVVLTRGFGAIAVCPAALYLQTALTVLYQDLSGRNKADEVEFPSLDPDDYDPNEAIW